MQEKRSIISDIRVYADKKIFVFFACGLLGILLFIFIYGVRILDFTYTDWLLRGGDLSQHFLGWRFFRESDWFFPIGLMDNIIHPFLESIIYTDSIPLFAIPFKLLSKVLPQDFQYFGLFGLICFFLQGAMAGLILKRLTNNSLYALIGSMFFTLMPVLIFRMYIHTSLAAQFIVLLCVYVCLTKGDKQRSSFKKTLIWTGLVSLAAMTHIYNIPVVMIFMAINALDDCIVTKQIVRKAVETVIPAAVGVFLLYILGAFEKESGFDTEGLGFFSINFNSIFNPREFSTYLRQLEDATEGQYEGFAYLGLGIIIGLSLTIVSLVNNFGMIKAGLKDRDNLRKIVLTTVLFIAFFVFALSPVVTLNGKILFTVGLPGFVESFWGIFRASGRFIWTPVYLIFIMVIWTISKEYKLKTAVIILSILLLVQYSDITGLIDERSEIAKGKYKEDSFLHRATWNELAARHERFFFIEFDFLAEPLHYSIADVAVSNEMTINDFYLARKDTFLIRDHKNEELTRILNGYADDGAVYIFSGTSKFKYLISEELFLYTIDDLIVGLSDDFGFSDPGILPVDTYLPVNVRHPGDLNIRDAGLTDEGYVLISPGGAIWSQHLDMGPGKYRFVFYGSGFSDALFDISYGLDGVGVLDAEVSGQMDDTDITDDRVELILVLDRVIADVHARCFNTTGHDIMVEEITLERYR